MQGRCDVSRRDGITDLVRAVETDYRRIALAMIGLVELPRQALRTRHPRDSTAGRLAYLFRNRREPGIRIRHRKAR
ncbi:MAG: hypothetical protein L0Z07_08455, partial [Planctomycetes bacterium]|nr:hypothetical protein [Planctomycetota bacterium]